MTRTSVLARNIELDALGRLVDGGSVEGYGGKRPKSVEDAPDGPRLFVCKLGSPAFKSAKAGSIKANASAADEKAAMGRATWYRTVTSSGAVAWDGEVGKKGSGAGCELTSVDIQDGAEVAIDSLVYTLPE